MENETLNGYIGKYVIINKKDGTTILMKVGMAAIFSDNSSQLISSDKSMVASISKDGTSMMFLHKIVIDTLEIAKDGIKIIKRDDFINVLHDIQKILILKDRIQHIIRI